jgi:hypothetical protein
VGGGASVEGLHVVSAVVEGWVQQDAGQGAAVVSADARFTALRALRGLWAVFLPPPGVPAPTRCSCPHPVVLVLEGSGCLHMHTVSAGAVVKGWEQQGKGVRTLQWYQRMQRGAKQ